MCQKVGIKVVVIIMMIVIIMIDRYYDVLNCDTNVLTVIQMF